MNQEILLKNKAFVAFQFTKADLSALLSKHLSQDTPLEQSIPKMSIPPSRTKEHKRRSLHHVKIIPNLQEMDLLEEEQMVKSQPVVKTN